MIYTVEKIIIDNFVQSLRWSQSKEILHVM